MRNVALLFLLGCSTAKMPPFLDKGGVPPPVTGGGTNPDASSNGDGGTTTQLASGQVNVRAIATDATWVYFTCASDGTAKSGSVRRVPKVGGTVQELVTGQDAPYALFLANGEAFYSTPDPTGVAGTIFAVPTAGGSPRTVVSGTSAASWLATDGSFVYFPTSLGGSGAQLERVSLGGGTAQPTAQIPGALAPNGIVVSQGWTYFAASGVGGGIFRAQTSGSTAEALDQETANFSGIAIAAGRLWVTDDLPTTGRLVSIPIAGGALRVDATAIDHPTHIASDGKHVYFTSFASSGSVGAVSIADGSLVSIASGLSFPWDLTVDDAVYVTVSDGVMRLPKL